MVKPLQGEIKVGVVGYGLAGRVFHTPFISAVPGLVLSGIVQRSGDSAARAWPHAAIYRNLDDLLHSDVDLVVIATPNATHAPMAIKALRAGKHVVVDKPMAGTWDDALAMETLSAELGLLLAPFHCSRWHGDFATLQSLLNAGTLGRLVTLEAKMDRFRPVLRQGTWKEEESEENGILLDLGPHMVDQVIALLGKPLSITADVRRDRTGSKIADAFDMGLEFERDGAPVHVRLQATLIGAAPGPRFVAHGTHGSFVKNGIDQQQNLVDSGVRVPRLDEVAEWWHEDEQFWGELTTATDPALPAELEKRRVPTIPRDYRGYYANIRDVLRGEAELAVTPRDGARTIRLLELAMQSSATRTTVAVRDTDWERE
jgi:scyllo-inositol 2-dehydrogenase (NADP+)